MFWAILATFIATSLGWIAFILFAINWAQNRKIQELEKKETQDA